MFWTCHGVPEKCNSFGGMPDGCDGCDEIRCCTGDCYGYDCPNGDYPFCTKKNTRDVENLKNTTFS